MSQSSENKAPVLRVNSTIHKRGEDDDRTIQFVISDDTRDRHGTVIPVSAWNLDNYNKNGIVAYMHETSSPFWEQTSSELADFIIGKGRAYVDGEQLIGEVTFEPAEINPLAEKIFRKVQHGTLNATSVGFVSHKGHYGVKDDGEDTGTYYFDNVELLEFSVVNIPSNPNAIRRSFTDFLKTQEPEVEEISQEEEKKEAKDSFLKRWRLMADILKLKH